MKICSHKCDQCLFSQNRIVSKKRMKEILDHCREEDDFFVCHKATERGITVQCRGFFDSQPTAKMTRIAIALNVVRFVEMEIEP